jgi:chromosome segregation ATPase
MPSDPPQVRLSQLAGHITPKVLDEEFDFEEEELEIDCLRSEVDDLHSKLGAREHVNAILGRKLKECTDQMEEMLDRTREQQQVLEKAHTSNQELRAELELLKSQQTQCEPRDKVSSEDLAALEAQFKEAEDYQKQLIGENAKLTGLFTQSDQAKRLVRVLKRLNQMNMEVSQILIICSIIEAGEKLNLISLQSMEPSSAQVEASTNVLQDCEGEVDLLGRGLEKIKKKFTERLAQQYKA